MLKEATYKEKFQILKNWMPMVIDVIKKDLKNDHLRKDWGFAKKYFAGKNLNKITNLELVEGYNQAMSQDEKGEEIAEFISNCWLLKNGELYHYFEKKLTEVNPNFSEIELLEKAKSQEIANEAAKEFGANNTYLFSVLNSVAFQEADLKQLKTSAENETVKEIKDSEEKEKYQSIDEVVKSYDVKLARSTDKYEKKIQGLQKKYLLDTESLKKQIASLQTKLSSVKK